MQKISALHASYLAILAMHPIDCKETRRIIRKIDDPFARRVGRGIIGTLTLDKLTRIEQGAVVGILQWAERLGTVHAPKETYG